MTDQRKTTKYDRKYPKTPKKNVQKQKKMTETTNQK